MASLGDELSRHSAKSDGQSNAAAAAQNYKQNQRGNAEDDIAKDVIVFRAGEIGDADPQITHETASADCSTVVEEDDCQP